MAQRSALHRLAAARPARPVAHARRRHAGGRPSRRYHPPRRVAGLHNRNYAADADGQWFFQNGPQRVYVELGYTPWIVRLSEISDETDGALRLTDHAGGRFEPTAVWLDDEGGVLFSDDADASDTPRSPRVAALHDHDLDLFSTHADLDDNGGVFHFAAGLDLALGRIDRADVPGKFGFVTSPAAKAAAS